MEGLEPSTYGFVDHRSAKLSHIGMLVKEEGVMRY